MEHAIWTEKYRPKEFNDVLGQDEVVKRVEAFVKDRNMPHLLFTGPAGVGKTSLSLVVARQLFGESWHNNFLELNASDERGIDVIRNKVKDFARTRAIGDVPFKIIYLDECDALTREAQQALRRTMENYTQTCRFILSANYSSKIIDPIQSRCAIFKFKPLPKKDILELIEEISKNESFKITDDAKDVVTSSDSLAIELLKNDSIFASTNDSLINPIKRNTLNEGALSCKGKIINQDILRFNIPRYFRAFLCPGSNWTVRLKYSSTFAQSSLFQYMTPRL